MNLSSGWIELNSALETMRMRWEEVKTDWHDAVCHDFEKDHWTPLESQVTSTLRAIDRLAPILAKAQQECS
ncbi:MAG TPA: hypothetical protein VKU02_19385 [Gemmataceae bacterium]|nr:hypothetical protein [Gemmataceae bacterium]